MYVLPAVMIFGVVSCVSSYMSQRIHFVYMYMPVQANAYYGTTIYLRYLFSIIKNYMQAHGTGMQVPSNIFVLHVHDYTFIRSSSVKRLKGHVIVLCDGVLMYVPH